jgi:hypothetical protein
LIATREPSGESFERRVAVCCCLVELFELLCAGLMIRLCAATSVAIDSNPALHRITNEALARQGEWLVAFIIGATRMKNVRNTQKELCNVRAWLSLEAQLQADPHRA